tara:strand:- start:269 stop:1063 length:795 start_codon:yes stop_codon:yes gene_type:complete
MTPLWTKRHEEAGSLIKDRAHTAKERRLEKARELALTQEWEYIDKLVAPWHLPKAEDRIARLLDEGEEPEEGVDAEDTLRSTRLVHAEIARLGVPMTSPAAAKIMKFAKSICELSKCCPLSPHSIKSSKPAFCLPPLLYVAGLLCAEDALLPVVKAKMSQLLPDVEWKLKDVGKVHLARQLERSFNAKPMYCYGVRKHHRFEAYAKLTPALQKVWDTEFGLDEDEPMDAGAEAATKPMAGPKRKHQPPDESWDFGSGWNLASAP